MHQPQDEDQQQQMLLFVHHTNPRLGTALGLGVDHVPTPSQRLCVRVGMPKHEVENISTTPSPSLWLYVGLGVSPTPSPHLGTGWGEGLGMPKHSNLT